MLVNDFTYRNTGNILNPTNNTELCVADEILDNRKIKG
jgi:hypothetical protein